LLNLGDVEASRWILVDRSPAQHRIDRFDHVAAICPQVAPLPPHSYARAISANSEQSQNNDRHEDIKVEHGGAVSGHKRLANPDLTDVDDRCSEQEDASADRCCAFQKHAESEIGYATSY